MPEATPAAPAVTTSSPNSMLDNNLDGSPKEGATQVRGADGKFVSGKAAAAPGQPGQVPKGTPEQAARKLKLQLEGKEVELDESEVITRAQKTTFAQQQASKLQKELDLTKAETQKLRNVLTAAMTDDNAFEGVLKALGRDPEKLALDILGKQMQAQIAADEEAKLSPEARELKQLRAEKAKALEDDKKKAEVTRKAEYQAAVANHVKLIENGIKTGLKDTAFEGNAFAERMFFDQVQNFVRLVETAAIHPKTGKPWTVNDFPSPKEIGAWLEDDIANALAGVARKNPAKARKYLTPEVLQMLEEKAAADAKAHPDTAPNSPDAPPAVEDETKELPVGLPRKPRKVKADVHLDTPAAMAEALFLAKKKKLGGPRGLAGSKG